jgi:uncharacterized protein YdcH (DUF465 family)
MTSIELKALVKEYFNLTEVKFGEIFDENKAFKIVFEGDQLELGMPVKVVTTDGQEMDAPDGFHKLEGGIVIKTEGSKVVELTKADMMEDETETLEGGKVIEEVKMAEVKTPEVVEQFPVEVQRGAEYEGKEEMETEEEAMTKKDIVEAVAKAVAEELTEMKKELMAMKDKMAKFAAEPAAQKTLPTAKKFSLEVSATNPVQAERYEMMKNIIKTKKSK